MLLNMALSMPYTWSYPGSHGKSHPCTGSNSCSRGCDNFSKVPHPTNNLKAKLKVCNPEEPTGMVCKGGYHIFSLV